MQSRQTARFAVSSRLRTPLWKPFTVSDGMQLSWCRYLTAIRRRISFYNNIRYKRSTYNWNSFCQDRGPPLNVPNLWQDKLGIKTLSLWCRKKGVNQSCHSYRSIHLSHNFVNKNLSKVIIYDICCVASYDSILNETYWKMKITSWQKQYVHNIINALFICTCI